MTEPSLPSPSLSVVSILAPAKINLILRILDRRPDGFHNLWSLMHTVGLEDEISIRLDGRQRGIRLQCDSPSLSTDTTNLVHRAASEVLRRSGRTAGLDITLTKRIPMGAGLGGGSSDAAATILALNRLLDLNWSQTEMGSVGQTVGSDVPFFFFAPAAVVSGRGEQVRPIYVTGTRWVVLVNPGFPVETKWAYRQLSTTRAAVPSLQAGAALDHEVGAFSWEQITPHAKNDFEVPVFNAHPALAAIKSRLLAYGAETALLSGSGATVFGVYPDEGSARQAKTLIQANPDFKVFVVPVRSVPLCVAVK